MKKILYCLLFGLLVMSCSHEPSVDKIKIAFENTEPNIKNGLFKVLSFEKVNAQKGVITGIKFYKVEYEAQIEFLKKVWELDPEIQKKIATETGNLELLSCHFLHIMADSSVGSRLGTPYNAGEIKKVNGTIVFQITENGWQVTDFSILDD